MLCHSVEALAYVCEDKSCVVEGVCIMPLLSIYHSIVSELSGLWALGARPIGCSATFVASAQREPWPSLG